MWARCGPGVQGGSPCHRPGLAVLPTAVSPSPYAVGGRRRTVVAVCITRLLGREYFQPESAGVEFGHEDMAELHRVCAARSLASNYRYQLVGLSSGYLGHLCS